MGSQPARISEPLKIGEDLELDLRAYELRRSGRALKLERIPMELLLLLVEQRGQLVGRDQIIERVWGKDVFVDADNSINAAIRKIRQALKDDPERPRFIQTITGKGYRFIAPVVEPSPTEEEIPPPGNLAPESRLGKKISHYRVLQFLGGGGMGVVYKAEDLKLGRSVAMKFLPAELATDSAAFDRLQREARAASRLDHPNLCGIYEFGEDDGQPFIVMPMLHGQTLRDWIETSSGMHSSAKLNTALELAVQICHGLEAAHGEGIIHRDIKPANIFVTPRGEAKILDFGVAKFVGSDSVSAAVTSSDVSTDVIPFPDPTITKTGASMGTPSYLSPEQVRGEKLDARTDLFSFGLVLHEMFTGRRVFAGKTASAIRDAVVNQTAPPVRQLNPELPPALETIIGKALEKDRDRRYQSAGKLRVDLERLREISAPRPSFWNRNRTYTAVALAILGALILGIVLERASHVNGGQAAAPVNARRSVAVLGFRNLSGRSDEEWISTALAEMLNTELASGQQLRVIPGENVARMKVDLALPNSDSYSPQTLAKVRQNLGTDVVVLGSYLDSSDAAGGSLRLDLQVQDVRVGETIAAISETGSQTQLAELVSQAGMTLRNKLGIAAVSDSNVSQTKSSLPANAEAVKLYSEGLLKLRSFDALGARERLERAVAADPEHALCHSALAEALAELGYDSKAQTEAKKAFTLSHNLPREDQLLIEGRYRQLTNDLPGAVEAYRSLWKFFPDDLEYGLRLASAQTKGSPKDALETVARMRRLPEPQNQDARIDVAEASAAEAVSDYVRTQQVAASAVSKAESQGSRLLMAAALQQEGFAYDRLGDREKAIAAFTKAHDLWAAAGDVKGAASALHSIGIAQYDSGKWEEARKTLQQALAQLRQIGAMWNVAACSHALGMVLKDQGQLPQAKAAFEEALRIQRELNDERGVASDLDDIGNVLYSMGDIAGAVRVKEEALQAFRHVDNKMGEAITLNNLGEVLLAKGDVAAARQRLQEALAIKRQIGYKRGVGYTLIALSEVLLAQDRAAEARAAAEEAIKLRQDLADDVNVALSQTQLGAVALQQGNAAEAETLARNAVPVFEKNKISDMDCAAETVLSRALLAQHKMQEAQAAVDRAIAFSAKGGELTARFDAELAQAAVKAEASETSEALRILKSLATETLRRGYVNYQLATDLQIGQLELNSGSSAAGRARLSKLQKDAQTRGFAFIARKAAEAISR